MSRTAAADPLAAGGTNLPLPRARGGRSLRGMFKRIFAGISWTLASWIVFSWIVSMLGLPNASAVLPAVAVGLFIGMDPMHRIWPKPVRASTGTPVLAAEQA
jgi:hypothetical protein